MTPEIPNQQEDRLRRQIYLAAPGATVYVEPGEHNGPFVFSRAISLVGKTLGSTLPTLITLRGPVAIVESPNVVLENLEFVIGDGDYRKVDPVLVHSPYCRPILKDVQFGKGRLEDMSNANQTSGWELPTMIAFGDLREKAWVALPLDIKVPGPTVIRSLLSGMKVVPDHLPGAGEYRLNVYFSEGALLKDSLLAGQLVFDYSGESKTVWIIGNVLPEKDFKSRGYPEFVLGGPSGRIYTSTDTFMLGRAQFQSERGTERWSDGLAFIIHETGDVWSLVQTRPQAIALRLNRQPVLVGHREVLKEGDELEIGDMKFAVLPKGKKSSQAVSGVINFGKLSTPGAVEARLMVENKSKTANWEGKLRATVPWIVVPGERFICHRGQQVSVPLALDVTQLGKLPAGPQPVYGALVLENDKEAWVVKALLDVDIDVTKISLEIQPRTLDFKKVTRPENHAGLKVSMRNTGSMAWSGTVRAAKWLTVAPTHLSIAPGKVAEVAVTLNANMDNLLEGPNSESEALMFEGQQVRECVAARIELERPRPSLQVSPAELDFGLVKEWRAAEIRLAVKNSGTADWQGEVKSIVDWLEIVDSHGQVVQGTLRLPAQGKADLTVRLKQSPAAGTYSEPAAIQWVRENKSEVNLPLKIVIEEIKIEPDPGVIDFKITDDPTSREKVLRIWNRSAQVWVGEVLSTLSWLVVNPAQIKIAPNKVASITVSVVMSQVQSNERLRNNKVKPVADAILLQSGGVTATQVGASIWNNLSMPRPGPLPDPNFDHKTVVMPASAVPTGRIPGQPVELEATFHSASHPAEGRVVLETHEVDFGKLPLKDDSLPAREILLSNPGPRPVECAVRTLVNWLTVEPLRFTILPQEQVRLKALLNEAARKLEPNRYIREDGIQVDWNNQAHNVWVALTVEKPVVLPQTAERIDFGRISIPVAQYPFREISIFNSLFFPAEVVAHSSVPWLTVTPERIQCSSKQTCTLRITLNPNAADLPEGPLTQAEAVVVEIAQKTQRHAVSLYVEKAAPLPTEDRKANEYVIDFAEVTDLSAGFPSRSFQLTNTSSQPIEGRVLSTNVIWITVTPDKFRIEPNGRVNLKVQLNKSARAKSYDEPRAIIIELSDAQIPIRVKGNVRKALASISGSISIPVTVPKVEATFLSVDSASPLLNSHLETRSTGDETPEPAYPELNLAKGAGQLAQMENLLDFGAYIISPDPLPIRTLALVNTSSQMIAGTVRINDVPWLTVDPVRFECAPGGKVLVHIGFSEEVRKLRSRGRPYRATEAVCVETGAQTFCLQASVQIQAAAVP